MHMTRIPVDPPMPWFGWLRYRACAYDQAFWNILHPAGKRRRQSEELLFVSTSDEGDHFVWCAQSCWV